MRFKNKSYAMDLICAVEHLEKILTEKVPMGEHEDVLKYVSDRLSKKKTVELPRVKEIKVVTRVKCKRERDGGAVPNSMHIQKIT